MKSDTDYFDDGGQQDAAMPKEAASDSEGDGKESNTRTGLINSDLCPGMKEGDMLQLRIVAVHDKEYEVEYEPEKESGEEPGEESPAGEQPPEAGGNPGMYD